MQLEYHLGAPMTSLEGATRCQRAQTTTLQATTTSLDCQCQYWECQWQSLRYLGMLVTSLEAPWINAEQPEKNNIVPGNAAGVLRNHSYHLSWNDFLNSGIQCVFLFIYLCNYESVELPIYTWDIRTSCRRCLKAVWGVPEGNHWMKSEIHSQAMTEWIWKCTWRGKYTVY